MFETFTAPVLRAVSQIDRILNAFWTLFINIFSVTPGGITQASYFYHLVNTIVNNQFLLIGLILSICGFVIGVLKRIINE